MQITKKKKKKSIVSYTVLGCIVISKHKKCIIINTIYISFLSTQCNKVFNYRRFLFYNARSKSNQSSYRLCLQ